MRWKLLRRRLSVSAPRVIVRSHLPWPLRWAALALVLGFSAAIALWAFELGKDIAGLDRDREREVEQQRVELTTLRRERGEAQAVANTAQSLVKTERATQEKLADQLRTLEAENGSLKADLGFFERLLPVAGDGLQLRGLQAEAKAPGQTRYQLLIMQRGAQLPEFVGRYEVLLGGTLDGRPWSSSMPDGPRPVRLRQYARVEGLIAHPVDVVLKSVQAKVVDVQGAVRATQTLRLP